jgi:hypothetical protein
VPILLLPTAFGVPINSGTAQSFQFQQFVQATEQETISGTGQSFQYQQFASGNAVQQEVIVIRLPVMATISIPVPVGLNAPATMLPPW